MAKRNPASTESVAERLRLTREALGMNQAQFAKRVGVTAQTWNNYERSVNRISLDIAIQVCDSFGVTLDWIYRGVAAHLPMEVGTEIMRLESEQAAARRTGTTRRV